MLINGCNSVANWRKKMIYTTNVELVNDNVYAKFVLYLSIRFQDIEQKLYSDVNQGPLLCCKLAEASKLLCMSSIPARMKQIQLKMKTQECSQYFSHYKSMRIFPDAQGQLIMQSMVGSDQMSNSYKTFLLSLLPAKMKKLQSKLSALDC